MQLRVERVDPNALRRSRLDPAGWGQLAPPFNPLSSLLDFCQLHELAQGSGPVEEQAIFARSASFIACRKRLASTRRLGSAPGLGFIRGSRLGPRRWLQRQELGGPDGRFGALSSNFCNPSGEIPCERLRGRCRAKNSSTLIQCPSSRICLVQAHMT
jgi:hypothetical protein